MPANNSRTLTLEGALDVTSVAGVWLQLRDSVTGIEQIDLAAVTALDSSGVALVRCLQAAAHTGGARPRVINAPARFAQIGLAHRVDAG
ncbi:MAG: STAS domain-containing protein [Pseudomarimonas sp.]